VSNIVIKAEDISKQYRLGLVGTGTVRDDMKRWWYTVRGKDDPFLKIGEANNRAMKGESDYVWSLRDINFEINQGDSVGIIGRNGAGKSTLLKILSQVTQPTTGKIYTKGRIASLLEVGTGFHPEMTGRENIYLNGAILGMRKNEIARKFDEIVAFSGVERYIDTPVKRYSSGMYVRLAFAVAAHLESEILIVDEVLAVGDAEFQNKCIGKMSDVSRGEGRTVLFVSHNMAAVKSLCSRGVLLENGQISLDGDVNSCVDKYYNFNEEIKNRTGVFIKEVTSENPCITKVQLIKESNEKEPSVRFYHDEDITIDIEYSNLIPIVTFSIGIALLDSSKNKVFTTHFDYKQSTEKIGKLRCTIPKDLLNQGVFSFDVAIFQKGGEVFHYVEDICEFQNIDRGSELYYQVNEKIGAIRVNCKWEVQ